MEEPRLTRPVWLDAIGDLAANGEFGLTATDLLLAQRMTRAAFDWGTMAQVRHLSVAQIGELAGVSEATAKRFLERMRKAGLLVKRSGTGRKLRKGGVSRETFLYQARLAPHHLRRVQMPGHSADADASELEELTEPERTPVSDDREPEPPADDREPESPPAPAAPPPWFPGIPFDVWIMSPDPWLRSELRTPSRPLSVRELWHAIAGNLPEEIDPASLPQLDDE